MNLADLKQKSESELKKELQSLLQEQFNLRMQKGSGQLAKPHLFEEVRRNIARVKTLLRANKGNVA